MLTHAFFSDFRSSRRVQRRLWLVLLSMVLSAYLALLPAQAETEEATAEMHLLTLNTWGLPFPLGQKLDERVPRIAKAIAGFDVVLLQETFDARFDRLIELSGYPHAYHHKNASFGLLRSGLLTLSRYPIIHTDFEPFRDCVYADCLARKGVLLTRIQHPELGPVDVYNTHYQSRRSAEDIRRLEDNTVMQRIYLRNNKYYPSFFAGDFNFEPDSPAYRDLQRRLSPADVFRLLHPDKEGLTTGGTLRNNRNHNHRIDYIFARPGPLADVHTLESEVVFNEPFEDFFLSDHMGVRGRFRVHRHKVFWPFRLIEPER